MSDFFNELIPLVNNIFYGKCGLSETKKRIKELEEKYGDDIFLSCNCNYKDKKDWDRKYLDWLKTKSITGMADSKPFILHLAEVSETVYRKEKRKKFFLASGSAVGITAIICAIICLVKAL